MTDYLEWQEAIKSHVNPCLSFAIIQQKPIRLCTWEKVVTRVLRVPQKRLDEDPIYFTADAKKRVTLLRGLFTRLLCCKHALTTSKRPFEQFDTFCIPSWMYRKDKQRTKTWDYTLFETKYFIEKAKENHLPGIFALTRRDLSPKARLLIAEEAIENGATLHLIEGEVTRVIDERANRNLNLAGIGDWQKLCLATFDAMEDDDELNALLDRNRLEVTVAEWVNFIEKRFEVTFDDHLGTDNKYYSSLPDSHKSILLEDVLERMLVCKHLLEHDTRTPTEAFELCRLPHSLHTWAKNAVVKKTLVFTENGQDFTILGTHQNST